MKRIPTLIAALLFATFGSIWSITVMPLPKGLADNQVTELCTIWVNIPKNREAGIPAWTAKVQEFRRQNPKIEDPEGKAIQQFRHFCTCSKGVPACIPDDYR